ncbi:MAG: hypothetical protein KBS70_03995 [Bacteroidales bacterium]|nr:hypothetical protein [Candidatus Colicola equi]
MKTIKHIFILAASLMLLVNTSSEVYAYGNDWFEKDYNFFAYYDGLGSVHLSLLTWTEGASYNHWAGGKGRTDDKKRTYVQYSLDTITGIKTENKNWQTLFYYCGDNKVNAQVKKKETVNGKTTEVPVPGMAWFQSKKASFSFFTIPKGNELDEELKQNDSVSIPHADDERKSVRFNLRWAVPTNFSGKYLSIKVHVCDERQLDCTIHDYEILTDEKVEEGIAAPKLMEPTIFLGGSDPKDAGTILVPYVIMDELVSIETSTDKKPITGLPNIGSLSVKAQNDANSNFYITAVVKRANSVQYSLKSNQVTIPAYHTIDSFTVTPKMDMFEYGTQKYFLNSGYKCLKWKIKTPSAQDAMSMDFFEIERAYKSDFSDAEQIAQIEYKKGQGTYEYVDESTINNPYGGDSIFYRIRRMSASSYGWNHDYAKSYTYVGRVKQIGLDLYKNKSTPYAAFRDCATDSAINNSEIDFTGQLIWPVANNGSTIAWDPLTKIEVVLWENGEEAQRTEIKNLQTIINGTTLVRAFGYRASLPKTCQEYFLSVRLNTDATRFDKPEKTDFWFFPKRRTEAINMTSATASNNDDKYPERTLIEWTADGEPDYFALYRDADSIGLVDGRTNWYKDPDGVPGQTYTYMVKAVTYCTNRMESTTTTLGTRSSYGYIDGFVTYSNGDKMANIKVGLYDADPENPLQIVTTDANGYYKFSKIAYNLGNNGSTYKIQVRNIGQNFRPASGGVGPIQVTLTASTPAVHHVDFLSDDYRRCSGRVLYTGTTIPVRDAYFLISGQVAKSSGDTIRTDASGNFTLSVPSKIDFTVTVVKDKHTFVNDGKLMIGGTDTLNLSSGSLDGVKFWDNTRVRLIGRLAGGDVQGEKPLGFGLSKNNLGDSLKLVLELEGDNIAHFVYDEKDLTKKTSDTTYARKIGNDTLRTYVHFEQKRIIIRPESKTGEYMIDLPPVKYRIVEASANGYATLFSAGRTSETKDLTFSLDTQYIAHEGRASWYHDTYSVIYHAPASVKVAQLRYGMPIEYYGEDAVKGYTLSQSRIDSVYTHKDKKYVFGYPVYLSGLLYTFRIYAYEEYHYNNDISRDLDAVALGGHKITVYNGLSSGTSIVKGQLNDDGTYDVAVGVANESFGAVGTDALKHLDVSVNVNGQDVHAEPIQAFVLGGRITGSDAIASAAELAKIGEVITVDDVLRDPPGSNSYAWIEKGATYNSSYSANNGVDASVDLTLTTGTNKTSVDGIHSSPFKGIDPFKDFYGEHHTTSSEKNWPIFSFSLGYSNNSTYNYSYTTSERIQTGNNNNIMGADATIFIGHTVNTYAMHSEVFTTVDAATLSKMQASIATGETKIIKQKDPSSPALIVTKDLAFTMDPSPVQFVYTQDHIVNQVIPQLVAEMLSLLLTGTEESVQQVADSTNKPVYWGETKNGGLVYDQNADTIKYTILVPTKWKDPKYKRPPFVNELHTYIRLINRWAEILYDNEYKEFYGTTKMNRVKNFSISANTTVTYSETGSAGYNYSVIKNEKVDLTAVKLLPEGIRAWANKGEYTQVVFGDKSFKIDFRPVIDPRFTQTSGRNLSQNRTIGFTLSQAEYGYIDVDVYNLAGTVDTTFSNWRNKASNSLTEDSLKTGNYDCSDFIYLLRGGATRCPWIGENKTKFYRPGTTLDPATVKLDEAHLEVNQHEVSGVAADGVAVFDLQIWNESEAAPGVANGPHNFVLKLLEGSNPNGAKASIDGLALTGMGRNFYLEPGQVIHKKMEVRQGALALDYDSLKLCLMSDCDTSNYANQYVSVHFLPASTPVHIATPDDKWVMNTNSPYDKQGYYLPVVIDGFDPDYENFDHIELQYKLSTQSESNWVTLCSYYVDKTYYDKASGNKQMFNKAAGRIDNIHFYGERDPMEQRYDLRAVSYCRYGTGYVSKASEPVSGIKDTRRPELFGNVSPANGVLTQQDYISVPFSEPIAYNYLDEDNNFQVIGFKNKADYFSMPTLAFSGNSSSYARTQTARDLSHGDFSIDIVVYPDADSRNTRMAFFSTGQPASDIEQAIEFGYNNKRLYARICDKQILSNPIDLPHSFTRVTLTYRAKTGDVYLYVGTDKVGSGEAHITAFNAAPLTFGLGMNNLHPFKGRMAEARIWSKALTLGEITSTNNTCLTGYENGLLAYYPMIEGSGNIAYDKAHSANATLKDLTWNMPEGLALQTNEEGVKLNPKWFNNSADADYTLLFSFRSNPLKPFSNDALLFGDVNAKNAATNKQIGIFMTQTGQIVLVSDSVNKLVADGNYNDGAWHTLGLVVSRSFNYTHLYIDDKLKAHADGQFFGAWAMSQTILGRNFNGYFDELSIWELAMPQSYLSEFTTYAPNGQEFGLRCYLPFDQRIKNASSIYETHYSRYNARLYYNSDNREWYAKQDTVVVSELDDKSTTKDVCPLIRESEYEKMRFSWTSRDNDLVINLKMPDAEINHKNIFFSLRDVEDLQGNRLLSPIAWSVYLDRNIIRWDEQNLWVEKSASPVDTVVYTTITNYSGETKPFVITGLPEWLTVDEPIGTLQPQEQRVLAFTISGDLNAGDYVVPVALTDEADLSDQMLINVRINAVSPSWSVPNSYNLNMNLIGTVHLQDEARGSYIDTDTRDIVGAFYGNTCVGMQSITSKVGSTANLYLKVYGDDKMDRRELSLRLWQASTGKTFVLIPTDSDPTSQSVQVIRFVADTVYGSVQKPVQLRVADSRVQNIPVYKGWNWISFNVRPTDINSSFINVGGFSSGNQIKTYRTKDNASVYTSNGWSNNIQLDYHNIYMLKVTADMMVLEVRGSAADKVPELTFGGGWNNLPCLFEANTPIDAAMADYFNAANDGDIITGYYQFAVFDNKQWVGSLETLIPGEGYMLYRQSKDAVTVHFNPVAPASAPRKKVESERESDALRASESRTYSTVMPIVATLEENQPVTCPDDAILRAYAHDELVGEAQAVDGVWFLLVHAAEGSELTFTVTDDKGEEKQAANMLHYGALAPTGTISNPYLIRFGESDLRKVIDHGILYIHRNGNVYDAQGALVK